MSTPICSLVEHGRLYLHLQCMFLFVDVGSYQLHHRLSVVQSEADGRCDIGVQAPAECRQPAVAVTTDRVPPRISHSLQG